MATINIDVGSFARGIVDMKPRSEIFKRWTFRRDATRVNRKFWIVLSTPAWHDGRGPYVSIGLGWIAIYRGY